MSTKHTNQLSNTTTIELLKDQIKQLKSKLFEAELEFERLNAPETRYFKFECKLVDCVLDTYHIWPDGDAPKKPTAEDVMREVEKYYGDVDSVLNDWGLLENAEIVVTEVEGPKKK